MMSMYTKNINTHLIEIKDYFKVAISVDCVVFGFAEDKLKVLLIKSDLNEYKGKWSLLGDIVPPDEELDAAAYRVLHNRTGLDNVYLEQVQTFGAIERHPAGRVITVAYYALVDLEQIKGKTTNADLYWLSVDELGDMAFDHQQILNACVLRLQQQMMAQPVGFNLLPLKFSLRELQSLYESVFGRELDRRNFRKKFLSMDLLEDLNEEEADVRHRPARLYKFNFIKYDQQRKRNLGITF
ncbi:NUDIX domain-containing protein [Chitinophaga silvatica]|uniref:NUDIX domain-containing protein n=1 Tax=Chitinophaga silvatica TaxID=2282649 RepID=A0A3E1YCH9_9BACT|nr:NUDIX domain-containing protein [Chitinophaga silvatica]RFS23968.1 NUDIX domain-containing protein [Chitinophaga silvatica]